MNKACYIFLIILICLTICSCSEKQTLTNEKGEMLKYEIDEVFENGFYMHDKENDTFTPLMNACEGFDGLTGEYDECRYIWFGLKGHDLDKLVPKIDRDKYELVLWQNDEGNMPASYVLERYKSLGYTFGIKICLGQMDSKLFLLPKETCTTSMASDTISSNNDTLPIYSINGEKNLPLNNIDTDVNMFLGLEKGKKYEVKYFNGTSLKEKILLADTHAFKSKKLIELDFPLKTTERGYFIVKLPYDLKPGYYYINDAGLFKYVKR